MMTGFLFALRPNSAAESPCIASDRPLRYAAGQQAGGLRCRTITPSCGSIIKRARCGNSRRPSRRIRSCTHTANIASTAARARTAGTNPPPITNSSMTSHTHSTAHMRFSSSVPPRPSTSSPPTCARSTPPSAARSSPSKAPIIPPIPRYSPMRDGISRRSIGYSTRTPPRLVRDTDGDPHARGTDAALSSPARAAWVLCAGLSLLTTASRAGEGTAQEFAAHVQFTYTEQATSGFNAPYSGPNSLSPNRGAETIDATLFLGARIWPGAELWVGPEIDQGFGLDDTLGAAAFPSGEAYKIGKNHPYLRLQRLFVRQTVDLGEQRDEVAPSQLQLGGAASADRLVVTAGKFGVPDVFDDNAYAHDPRNDFLNWAAIDAGTFDYAADSWGYTLGAAFEWYHGPLALRFGVFDLSDIPNSPDLEPAFHEFQLVAEIEKDFAVGGHAGKIRATGFDSRGRMGLLDQAVALAT